MGIFIKTQLIYFIILHFFNLCYSSVHPLVHERSQVSQQFLSTAETSMHSLISVLQKILMTFMNIYNGLGGVNEQRFYVLTDTPNYDIDSQSFRDCSEAPFR